MTDNILNKSKKLLHTKNKKALAVYTFIGIGLIFLIWFLISNSLNSSLFPSITSTFKQLGSLLSTSNVYAAIGGTLLRLIIAFLSATLCGLIFGVISGLFRMFRFILNPFIILLRTLPTAAIIFVIIVLLKPVYALLIIVFIAMFPIIYESVVMGVDGVNKDIKEALEMETLKYSFVGLFSVILPCSRKSIVLGMIQALGIGMKVSIMAEVLCGTDSVPGLGRILYHGYIEGDMVTVFSVALIAVVLIGIFDYLLRHTRKIVSKLEVNYLNNNKKMK